MSGKQGAWRDYVTGVHESVVGRSSTNIIRLLGQRKQVYIHLRRLLMAAFSILLCMSARLVVFIFLCFS